MEKIPTLPASARTRLRAEALEPELNAAILVNRQGDFLLENLDWQSLFSESLNVITVIGCAVATEIDERKQAPFQRWRMCWSRSYGS